MKLYVDLDAELVAEAKRMVSLTGENLASVLRMAIRLGLPIMANRFQAPRPEGYLQTPIANIPGSAPNSKSTCPG